MFALGQLQASGSLQQRAGGPPLPLHNASKGTGTFNSSNNSSSALASSTNGPSSSSASSNNYPASLIPRRRVSYLIPPPPASQPPPLLVLPSGTPQELRAKKRCNPNPLIVLAPPDVQAAAANAYAVNGSPSAAAAVEASSSSSSHYNNDHPADQHRRTRRPSGTEAGHNIYGRTPQVTSSALSSSLTASSASSLHYHSNNPAVQRHPEHTLGITALALDTSTAIDSDTSYSSSRKKVGPGGILYSGGRDGLVAAWELGLPFKQRDAASASYVGGYKGKKRGTAKRYMPRWAEDSYGDGFDGDGLDDEEDDNDDDELAMDVEDRRNSSDSDDDTSGENVTDISNQLRRTKLSRPAYEDYDDTNEEAEELLLPDDERGNDDDRNFQRPFNPAASNASPRLRVDPNYQHSFGGTAASGTTSGLQLNLNNQRQQRHRRSTSSSYKRFNINGSAQSHPQKTKPNAMPYEQRWCLDSDIVGGKDYRPQPTAFRQAHRGHTNWVNDIVLCNLNQTVVSASSDRMIRAWNPHDPHRSMLPAALGSHSDYVKCLAHARSSGWIASGGFDRKIKIWDIMESRQEPILDYEMTGSVYALGTNPSGSTIVAGSPQKVVRIFDPRTSPSSNPVAGLVGHADNVRALLVSEDGRHVLSASTDATVRIWSVGMRRCLHTFTHHSDSVWSLFSTHPDLEVFYSGDRAGVVCKVDFENAGDIASEGECVILLKNRDASQSGTYSTPNDGIHRIAALDDTYVWTASASSNICRWRDIPRKSQRRSPPHAPSLSRHATGGAAGSNVYPTSIPEHYEVDATRNSVSSAVPIAIKGAPPDDPNPGMSKLGRARSNSSMTKDRGVGGSQQSVTFANSPFQRSSPGQASPLSNMLQSPQQQRPSSLRFSTATRQPANSSFAPSSPPAAHLSPILSSPKSTHDERYATALTTPTTPFIADEGLPSLNGIPLESLVPLFESTGAFGRSSTYGFGSAAAYSASVLSLQRTTSRGPANVVSSPFAPGNFPTPPSSGLSGIRLPLGYSARSPSPANALIGGASSAYHRPSSIIEGEEGDQYGAPPAQQKGKSEAYLLAQSEFEDRASALDGVPLRLLPDDVVRGRSGLVRAEFLNDRRTVLSLDTQGDVAVWDVLLGECIGRFAKQDLRRRPPSVMTEASVGTDNTAASALQSQPYDVLEFVRSQIEGEAIVQSWCTVECRTGLLTVHIEQSRAFDAEVYLDEAGIPPKPEYRVDQRLNLGKWILRNLFDVFVREEVKAQGRRDRSDSVSTSGAASIHSNSSVEELAMSTSKPSFADIARAPSHISIPDSNQSEQAQSWNHRSFSTALATPAMTPAVLPHESDLASHLASPRLLPSSLNPPQQLPCIPQSPHGASTVPATPMSTVQRGDGDYFSPRPRTAAVATAENQGMPNNMPTPKAGLPPVPATPTSNSPAVKTSKMSRFKSFGKKDTPKKEAGNADTVIGREGDETPVTSLTPQQTGTAEDDRLAHMTPVQKAQISLLQAVFAHKLQTPQRHDTPPIRFGTDLPLMIEEETHDAGAWATVYRSTTAITPNDFPNLEMHMPPWVLEFLCHSIVAHKDPIKIAFILEPHGGPEEAGFDALPSGNARLSATRMLRMRKACHYVAEKLELESWKQRQRYQASLDTRNQGANTAGTLNRSTTKLSLSSASSYGHLHGAMSNENLEDPTLLPEDEVEILCNGVPVPLNITLAACSKYCYGKSGDVYLTYRRRQAA